MEYFGKRYLSWTTRCRYIIVGGTIVTYSVYGKPPINLCNKNHSVKIETQNKNKDKDEDNVRTIMRSVYRFKLMTEMHFINRWLSSIILLPI